MTNTNPHAAQLDEVFAEIRTKVEERLGTNPIDAQAIALATMVRDNPHYAALWSEEVENQAVPIICGLVAIKVVEAS